MSSSILTIKNNAVLLPTKFGKRWNNVEVAVVAAEADTLILKRVRKPTLRLAAIATRIALPRMSRSAVNREIAAYRSNNFVLQSTP